MTSSPRRGDEPGYRRVATALRRDIENHRWDEATALPTDGELERAYSVSRQTVRRAYLELVNEGLVYRVPGRGTFATPMHLRYHRPFGSVDDLLSLSTDTELEVLHPIGGTSHPEAAAQLQLQSRLMYGMRVKRRHQGVVFCHTSVFLPPHVGVLIENDDDFAVCGATSTSTIIGALIAHGIQISSAEQSMTARACEEGVAIDLGCQPGTPVLHIERRYLDPAGTPVEWAVSDFLPEHYTHRVHLGRRLAAVPADSPIDHR